MSETDLHPGPHPKVSVVVPAYNATATLERCLKSALEQSLTDIEIIVVDDCSKDDTFQLAKTLLEKDSRPHKAFQNEINSGPSHTRNAGVRAATGDFVAFLDADDIWLPGKLEAQLALFEKCENLTLCGCQAWWVSSQDGSRTPLFQDLPEIYEDGLSELFWNCYVATPCAMVRREDLGSEPFNPELRVGEDRDLWLKLASNGTIGLVQEPQVLISLNPDSYMPQHADAIRRDVLPVIRRHLDRLQGVVHPSTRRLAEAKLLTDMGKANSLKGKFITGQGALFLAALYGFKPIDNIRHAILTLPPVRALRRALSRLRR